MMYGLHEKSDYVHVKFDFFDSSLILGYESVWTITKKDPGQQASLI